MLVMCACCMISYCTAILLVFSCAYHKYDLIHFIAENTMSVFKPASMLVKCDAEPDQFHYATVSC